jgi:ArsR family transcriptional regulator
MGILAELAKIFKGLADENRLAIFELIRECCPRGGRLATEEASNTVSEIAKHFSLSLSTVSHHIKELRTAGLIHCEKRGRWIYCAVNSEVLDQIDRFAQK